MNYWTTFLLLAGGQGLLLSLALISSAFLKKWSNVFLGVFTYVIALEILGVWELQSGNNVLENRFPFWDLSSYLLIPASIYLFGKINTQSLYKLGKIHWLFFLPAFLEVVVEISAYFSNQYFGTEYRLFQISIWYFFTQILPLILLIVALLFFGIDLFKLSQKLKNLGSQTLKIHIIKITVIYGVLVIFTLLWFLEAVLNPDIFQITLFILCFFVFALGYISFIKPDFFNLPSFFTKLTQRVDNSISEDEEEMKRIHQLFLQDKIYLQPKLSLKEAAQQLKLPPRQLSELINKFHGIDFRRYVNSLRVEEVVRKVENGEHETKNLLGIALESGFNSKSSFNQTFKEFKGKSPSSFFKTIDK